MTLIEVEVAYHLEAHCKSLQSGNFEENCVFNASENHFVVDHSTDRTLPMKGDEDEEFTDIVSRDQWRTVAVIVSSGSLVQEENRYAKFQNKDYLYPVRGVLDDTPFVLDRKGAKGWMRPSVYEEVT